MNKIIITAIIAIAGSFIAMPSAEAGGCNSSRTVYRSSYTSSNYCPPKVYKVKTVEVSRCRYQKTGYDKCGKRYCYWVTVITYNDVYSNGQRRSWTRTV